ncbi:Vms1/Ankzf1 family peptidyl-tRNA hydrolase [Halomarina litorea]|uniref:Vms1/Ankzf1 family peptidyl-tRNA hydrolase n=1 Tax=Halomarina litorea TaxID=2961595 RepID=UPI0020C1BA20|nr:Vms1/Ankzf1 family peptidyl-tRNA hydrolase [Halomarina sp. BCD28]
MLDRVLGRADLKARIEELESEKHHLARQLAAEQERRSEAATARQEAEEQVNRLEDRLAGLEGELDADESTSVDPRRREALRGVRLRETLSRLASYDTGPEGALSAMVCDDVPEGLADLLGDHAGLVGRAAPCLVYADDAGVVSVALSPPRAPDPFCEWGEGFRLDRSWFRPGSEEEYVLALVRADTFAMGRYEGDERVDYSGFRSDVKEQHSKGGFSQGRFERIRDGQIDAHLDRCRRSLAGIEVPLYLVGERAVLDRVADRADLTRTVDATGSPEDALADAHREFWTTRLVAL